MDGEDLIPNKIPKKIWKRREYDDIILYALNTFGPLPRPVFINNEQITNRMNKNTFHDHAKRLKNAGYIDTYREGKNSVYKILSLGESELLRNLFKYGLDLETILKFEQQKTKNLVSRLDSFFIDNKIQDIEIKKEILNHASIITIDRLKDIFTEESKFNKLILYLALNHPKFYPKFSISIEDFIKKYNNLSQGELSRAEIEIFVQKVIRDNVYETHFHRLKVDNTEKELFFSENSEYGKIFQLVVDLALKDLILLKNLGAIELNEEDLLKKYNEIAYNLINQYKLFDRDLLGSLVKLIDNYRKKIKKELISKSLEDIKDFIAIAELPEEIPISTISNNVSKKTIISEYGINKKQKDEKLLDQKQLVRFDVMKTFTGLKSRYKDNLIQKAWELFNKNDFRATLNVIDKIINIDQDPEMYYWKAEILVEYFKKTDDALKIIEKGIKINPLPSGYNFYKMKAQIFLDLHDPKEALKYIDKALEIDFSPHIFEKKVEILIELNKFEEAIDLGTYNHVTPKKLSRMLRKRSETVASLYGKLIESGKWISPYSGPTETLEIGLDAINYAIDIDPEDLSNLVVKIKILFNIDKKLEVEKIAVKLNRQLNKLDYDYQITYAGVLMKIKKYEQGIKVLENTIETTVMNPESYWSIFNSYELLIEIYKEIKSSRETLMIYDRAIAAFPDIPPFYWEKGKLLKKLKRFDEALEMFEKSTVHGIYAKAEQAEIFMERGDSEHAYELINQATEVEPTPKSYKIKIDLLLEIAFYNEILQMFTPLNPKIAKIRPYIDVYIYACLSLIDHEQYELAARILKIGNAISPTEIDPDGMFETTFSDIFISSLNKRINQELNNKNFNRALTFSENFLVFAKNDLVIKLGLDLNPKFYEYMIVTLINLNLYEKAIDIVDEALTKWSYFPPYPPEHLISTYPSIKFYRYKANILYHMGEYSESLELLNKIIRLNPDISDISEVNKSISLNEFRLGNEKEAIKSIDNAIQIEQKNSNVYYIK